MTGHFEAKQVDSSRVVAEMLLAHVIGCERMRLYMEADRPASSADLTTLRALVARAALHEPVQYLVGHAWFFGRQFEVDRSTLIPRPATETLVEHVIQWQRLNPGHAAPRIGDIGTGTGCIAISLALQIGDARVVATDIQSSALELAARNAQRHKVAERIEFRQGDGAAALSDEGALGARYDMICSNPPYISDAEWADVPANVKDYEPASALHGGADGLSVIRPLIPAAAALLKAGGLLAVEIAFSQREAAVAIARATGMLDNIDVLKDHEGLWRVLVAERA